MKQRNRHEKRARHTKRIFMAVLLAAAAWPAMAGARLEGWGPRVGLADDPDQVVLGAHWDLGEITRYVRFVPNVEIGLGDDHTLAVFTAPVYYVWRDNAYDVKPYAGGGISFGLVHRDSSGRGGDDTEFEAAIRATGGLEWQMRRNTDFFLEMSLVAGDLHDIEVLAGWTFRNRRPGRR